MTLPTLRKLTWLSMLVFFFAWLATADTIEPPRDGTPVKLRVPTSNAPEFLA